MPKKAKPNFGNVKSGSSTTAPVRIPGHATKSPYQRNKLEKIVDDVGKAIRRVPSDIRTGIDTAKGAVNAVKDKANRIKRGGK